VPFQPLVWFPKQVSEGIEIYFLRGEPLNKNPAKQEAFAGLSMFSMENSFKV